MKLLTIDMKPCDLEEYIIKTQTGTRIKLLFQLTEMFQSFTILNCKFKKTYF